MFPGFDAKKMQGMMKQLGIAQEEIDASRVVIEKSDGGKLIVENPNVTKIKMQGQETFQISGEISEESGISEEDVQTIIEKTGVSEKTARETLEKNGGDLAEAIMELGD